MNRMRVYWFSDTDWETRLSCNKESLTALIQQIAHETNTNDLVIVNYFCNKIAWSGGVACARDFMTPGQFISHRGRWKFTRAFGIPNSLPPSFKLIRLQFGLQSIRYPLTQIDRYGWKLTYPSFLDHYAFLCAHELHHFRRYHLGLHQREGENSANKWALERIRQLGHYVEGAKLVQHKKKKRFASLIDSHLMFDPYKKYRSLETGDRLLIKYDPRGYYKEKIVAVVRPMRKNSRRIVVDTGDGKQWRWPLEWVSLVR
ncbi:hypothetical protein L0Z72_12075 [candidate division KSB1 bacterium]|nr:hypothetical protein [candidate division KSB1 bacterium]